MPPSPSAARGEVWLAALDPVRGHEQAGTRPVLVISVDRLNKSPAGLVVVVPLTSRNKGYPTHVEAHPPEGGIKLPSWIRCEDIRAISTDRLVKRWGVVSPATRQQVEQRLRVLLGL